MIADRLVNELMLVSVLVAGEGAAAFAEQLEAAGAAADLLGGAVPQAGFDLAILLASPDKANDPTVSASVAALAGASNRLLFAPLPLRDGSGASQALLSLNDWFEIFAEHGYQPVVDFDADFVAAGAFLVDREATAAESELAAFAERLQNPAAAPTLATAPEDDSADQAEHAALHAEIAALRAEIAASRQATEAAYVSVTVEPEPQHTGWDALVPWVNGVVADRSRNEETLLRHELPRLLELRGTDAPPFALPRTLAADPPRAWLRRLFRRARKPAQPSEPEILADIALVRASKFFDAAWYIASTPELYVGEALDPVFHYVLVGTLRGADPGPWFNTAEYLAAHPQAKDDGACPLVHAIRSGGTEQFTEAPPE